MRARSAIGLTLSVLLLGVSVSVLTQSGVPPSPPSAAPSPSGDIVFRDTFEYVVGRSDEAAPELFMKQGWSGAKTSQTRPGARGFLYTVTSIPGYNGAFPGGGSRVLAMEALPETLGGQTDFYLQYSAPGGGMVANAIPGDVWFQFWIYTTKASQFGTREKFFYVCNTDYPCRSHLWMIMSGSASYNPNNMFPIDHPSTGQFLWTLRDSDGVSEIVNNAGDPDARGNAGQSNTKQWIRPNQWMLVKMHFNTTRTTGNSWEAWIRPMEGPWTKVAEWIGGVTRGFTWNIPEASVGGHRVLRWPTTVDYNKTLYFDDFVIARSEAALPVYTR